MIERRAALFRVVGFVLAAFGFVGGLIGHSEPLLTATKDIDISEAVVVAKHVLS